MTVIISAYSQAGEAYHTMACRKVWSIDRKAYVSRENAERRGYTHCQYCAGEYDNSGGGEQKLYQKLKAIGEANAD